MIYLYVADVTGFEVGATTWVSGQKARIIAIDREGQRLVLVRVRENVGERLARGLRRLERWFEDWLWRLGI